MQPGILLAGSPISVTTETTQDEGSLRLNCNYGARFGCYFDYSQASSHHRQGVTFVDITCILGEKARTIPGRFENVIFINAFR